MFSSKDVALDLSVTDPEDDYYDDYIEEEEMERMRLMDREDSLEMTVEEIKDSLQGIRSDVRTVSRIQDQMLYSYTQDMKMAQRNNEKVTLWSLAHLSVLVAIGIVQVLMVKSLFSDKSFKYKMVDRFSGGAADVSGAARMGKAASPSGGGASSYSVVSFGGGNSNNNHNPLLNPR